MKCKTIYTSESKENAKLIARKLVEERLAACVGFFPLESIYWWKGKIEESKETGMLIKTKASLVDEIIKRIKELHSYECPLIEVIDVEKGNSEFLGWVEKETK